MSNPAILWHRSHSKNANFSDAKVRQICKTCAYGKQRHNGMDSNRVLRPQPSVPGQSFSIDAFSCTHRSIRGFKYCDLMRDNASQMRHCNSTKSRAAEGMVRPFTLLWNLNSTWRVFDHAPPDPVNARYILMDPENRVQIQYYATLHG